MDHVMRLTSVLEQEAAVAQELLLRMVSVRLLVAAGEVRMLARAGDEIDALSERLGTMELVRELVVADLRAACGADPLDSGWTLGALMAELDTAGLPSDELRDVAHRFAGTVGEIAELQPDVVALLRSDADVVRERQVQLEAAAPVVTYGPPAGR